MVQNRLLHRVCRRCRLSYSSEVPNVLKGGEEWPTRCPACGKLELKFIEPRDLTVVSDAAKALGHIA